MASQVDYCNGALTKLAQGVPIASMSETTPAARAFTRCYDRILDLVLAEHPWPFTLTAVALALDATDASFPGWEYRYAEPSDCITKLAVCGEEGVRASLQAATVWTYSNDSHRLPLGDGRVEFDVVYGSQQTCIVTDLEDAHLIYAARVTDTGRFPPLFGEALSCRLAMEVAPTLAGELGLRLAQKLEGDYRVALNRAAVHGMNESHEIQRGVTPSLAARGGY